MDSASHANPPHQGHSRSYASAATLGAGVGRSERPGADDAGLRLALVRSVQRARRRREALFDWDVFADPAWDMLLELYAIHLAQRRESVSGLCIASEAPPTTALRWIAKLEQDGLATRSDDSGDRRRSWIELTPEGLERMGGYFDLLPHSGLPI